MSVRERRYTLPEKHVVIPKNGWFVFFDPVQFSYIRVNEHGKAILESVGNETPADAVACEVASRFGVEASEIEEQVFTFLRQMTAAKFLHEGPYIPETVETVDMDKARPTKLYLHPTFKCNLKCVYCYSKKERKETDVREMAAEEWFDVLDQAREFGIEHVIFTGGEPLLRKDLFDLARYANSIGISSQLLTNAILIRGDMVDDIVNTFGTVGLSLDSHVRKTNDRQRGKGSFDATMRIARTLEERGFTYTFNATVTKHNVREIPGLYRFLFDQFDAVSISPTLYVPPSIDHVGMLPELDDYLEAMTQANIVVEEHYGDDKAALLDFHGVPDRQFHCGAAAGEISIGPDGSVYPCQMLQKSEFNAGSLRRKKLKDIYFNSPTMLAVRHCTVDNIDTCRDCDVKHLCGGGCRALAHGLCGSIDSYNDYSCEYLRKLAYETLWNSTCIPAEQLVEKRGSNKTIAS